MCLALTLLPDIESAAEVQLPDVGVELQVPLRALVVAEPSVDLHQLGIVAV